MSLFTIDFSSEYEGSDYYSYEEAARNPKPPETAAAGSPRGSRSPPVKVKRYIANVQIDPDSNVNEREKVGVHPPDSSSSTRGRRPKIDLVESSFSSRRESQSEQKNSTDTEATVPVEPAPAITVPIPSPKREAPTPAPPQQKIYEKVSYVLRRIKTRNLRGRRIHFQLLLDGVPQLCTKLKSDSPEVVLIAKGETMHFSDAEFAGAMLVRADLCTFSIRHKSQFGEELATVAFTRNYHTDQKSPRSMRVSTYKCPESIERKWTSRQPVQGPLGQWNLDFGDRSIVSSIKNAILIDSNDTAICALMKSGSGELTIEIYKDVDPLIVFGIGVASFLCKLP